MGVAAAREGVFVIFAGVVDAFVADVHVAVAERILDVFDAAAGADGIGAARAGGHHEIGVVGIAGRAVVVDEAGADRPLVVDLVLDAELVAPSVTPVFFFIIRIVRDPPKIRAIRRRHGDVDGQVFIGAPHGFDGVELDARAVAELVADAESIAFGQMDRSLPPRGDLPQPAVQVHVALDCLLDFGTVQRRQREPGRRLPVQADVPADAPAVAVEVDRRLAAEAGRLVKLQPGVHQFRAHGHRQGRRELPGHVGGEGNRQEFDAAVAETAVPARIVGGFQPETRVNTDAEPGVGLNFTRVKEGGHVGRIVLVVLRLEDVIAAVEKVGGAARRDVGDGAGKAALLVELRDRRRIVSDQRSFVAEHHRAGHAHAAGAPLVHRKTVRISGCRQKRRRKRQRGRFSHTHTLTPAPRLLCRARRDRFVSVGIGQRKADPDRGRNIPAIVPRPFARVLSGGVFPLHASKLPPPGPIGETTRSKKEKRIRFCTCA